jgi:hypothetical protein
MKYGTNARDKERYNVRKKKQNRKKVEKEENWKVKAES